MLEVSRPYGCRGHTSSNGRRERMQNLWIVNSCRLSRTCKIICLKSDVLCSSGVGRISTYETIVFQQKDLMREIRQTGQRCPRWFRAAFEINLLALCRNQWSGCEMTRSFCGGEANCVCTPKQKAIDTAWFATDRLNDLQRCFRSRNTRLWWLTTLPSSYEMCPNSALWLLLIAGSFAKNLSSRYEHIQRWLPHFSQME